MPGTPLRQASMAVARAHRHGGDVVAARRDLHAEKIAAAIERAAAELPPLTPAQRDRIAALLRGSTA